MEELRDRKAYEKAKQGIAPKSDNALLNFFESVLNMCALNGNNNGPAFPN
jgi:hypothetical protein